MESLRRWDFRSVPSERSLEAVDKFVRLHINLQTINEWGFAHEIDEYERGFASKIGLHDFTEHNIPLPP